MRPVLESEAVAAKHSGTRARQAQLLEAVTQRGEMGLEALQEMFGVSLATLRRDLGALEDCGLLERTWGGSRIASPIKYVPVFTQAARQLEQEKRRIAAHAAGLVEPGMTVGVSGGTTCTELARRLRGKRITVLTNALNVAMELYNHGHTQVILTGGTLNRHSYELVGDGVLRTLAEYHFDLLLVGCSGLTSEFGFSMRDEPEAAVARALCGSAQRVIVMADHSKLGKRTFARFAPMSAISALITDTGASVEQLDALSRAGLVVFTV